MHAIQQLIRQSLLTAPLLVEDLPETKCFDRSLLGEVEPDRELNLHQKLGHLYEGALEQLIDAAPSLELLASNLQIIDDSGVTLGELDFLLLDKLAERFVHLELAVKFYLAVETANGWEFPGPDPRDNWQNKLDRMRSHQFLISQLPVAQAQLKQRFGVDSIDVCQLIYGCLFYPMSSEARPLPEAVASDCRTGRWLYVSEWNEYFVNVKEVRLVPKALWPVERTVELVSRMAVITDEALKQLALQRCTMFYLDPQAEPYFLVPDCWLSESS